VRPVVHKPTGRARLSAAGCLLGAVSWHSIKSNLTIAGYTSLQGFYTSVCVYEYAHKKNPKSCVLRPVTTCGGRVATPAKSRTTEKHERKACQGKGGRFRLFQTARRRRGGSRENFRSRRAQVSSMPRGRSASSSLTSYKSEWKNLFKMGKLLVGQAH